MEHFLRGRPHLWLWKFNSKEKRKFVFVFLFLVWVNVSMFQGATDIIIGIGRYIGFADMGNAYRYRLSVSANKKAHIGNLANIMK